MYQTYAIKMAEKGGFEPPHRVNDLLAFQASPFSHLGTSPNWVENLVVDFSVLYHYINPTREKQLFFAHSPKRKSDENSIAF